MGNDFSDALGQLQNALAQTQQTRALAENALAVLAQYETETAAMIAKYLRAEGGVELDVDAIKQTVTRPYTLIPQNEQKALLVHWRGVKLPIFGWVKKQEGAFTIAEVSRGMDLLTPFPEWLKSEMGWQPPAHGALMDGTHTSVRVTSGDSETFKKRYGAHLGAQQSDGSGGTQPVFKIKSGDAWIKLVAQLVTDGILPWQPQPVAREDWDAKAPCSIELRDYQIPFEREFRGKGAVFFNLPPGGGKTYLSLYIMAHLRGKILILAPSVILCEQWRERVKEYAPNADVTILTYASGNKALEEEWTCVFFDEVQTLPADTFSKLAFLKMKYRVGLSASPWREDGRQYLITALSGFPVRVPWSNLIVSGALKRPRVIVVTVPNDAAKAKYVQAVLTQRRGGRALIFCDYLEQGHALADALDVPFVSGETLHKLERVQEAPVCVVSRIADRGLDFPDLKLVVEVAFMGKSREQEAQRLGRLLHSQHEGAHYLLFTPDEAERFRPRIYGIEAELAGAVDIEFINVGKVAAPREGDFVSHQRPARSPRAIRQSRIEKSSPRVEKVKPPSEMETLLAHPAIMRAIAKAEERAGTEITKKKILIAALKRAWEQPVDPDALHAILSHDAAVRYRKSYESALAEKLVIKTGAGYRTNVAEMRRIVSLAASFRGA